MPKPKITTKVRQVGFSERLASIADARAAQLGISTGEYIRHLIVRDHQVQLTIGPELSTKAETKLLTDLVNFLESEKDNPSPGAKTGDELIAQLDQV